MNSGIDSVSLALFTTLSPAGVVAFVSLAAPMLLASLEVETRTKLNRYLAIPLAATLIGFIASATHLGTPSNALHVFSGIGRSPLSNEVLAAVAFLLLGGSYWMMSFKTNFPYALARIWLALACVAGILLILMTSLAYSVETVPTWDTSFTPANLIFSALLAGPIIALFSHTCSQADGHRFGYAMVALSGFALVVGSVLLFVHGTSLASISNNETSAIDLVPGYFSMVLMHIILGCAGIAVEAFSLKRSHARRTKIALLGVACVFVLVAVFLPRITFYTSHMTVGF